MIKTQDRSKMKWVVTRHEYNERLRKGLPIANVRCVDEITELRRYFRRGDAV